MLKIIIKTIILVLIILSIYFIVNPSACSNLINGREVNVREKLPAVQPADKHSELFTPSGDRPLRTETQPEAAAPAAQPIPEKPAISYPTTAQTENAQPASPATEGVTDTNSLPPAAPAATEPADNPGTPASQETVPVEQTQTQERPQYEVDYAIANRYVELENKYLAQHKDSKNAAKDISYIVMDDFELTPAEWEAFLQRATAENLFEKVRQEQAKK